MLQESNQDSKIAGFTQLLSSLSGVIELKVVAEENNTWIGIRLNPARPATSILLQVDQAAVGYGLELSTLQFGILID